MTPPIASRCPTCNESPTVAPMSTVKHIKMDPGHADFVSQLRWIAFCANCADHARDTCDAPAIAGETIANTIRGWNDAVTRAVQT